jgi:hypothetical protein
VHHTISQKPQTFFEILLMESNRGKQMYKLNSLDNDTGEIWTRFVKQDSACNKSPKKYERCIKVNTTNTAKELHFCHRNWIEEKKLHHLGFLVYKYVHFRSISI